MIQLAGGVPEEKPGAVDEILPADGEETGSSPVPNDQKDEAKPAVFKCTVCGLTYERCGSSHCGLNPDEHHKVNHTPTHGAACKGNAEENPAGK
jgi:hypothetical protein